MKKENFMNIIMNILLIMVGAVPVIMICVCLTGCLQETAYTEESMHNALDAVGMPDIVNFYERQQLKSIYELRDDPELICYWYTKNQMTGKWVFEGTCMGYGIPYGASMTNSQQLAKDSTYVNTIDLAEPNGLYTSNVTSSATWILSVDSEGNITPTYVEQEISVRQKLNKIDVSRCEEWSIPENY